MDTSLTPRCTVGRSADVTSDRIQERNEFIVSASLAGLTNGSILRQVNILSDQKRWGQLATIRSVERVIAQYFADDTPMTLNEVRSYQAGLREAAFAQQEKLIENAVFFRARKKEWAPFEYMDALWKTFKMMQQIVDNRGWNYSKLPARRMEDCGFDKPKRIRWKDAQRAAEVLGKYSENNPNR